MELEANDSTSMKAFGFVGVLGVSRQPDHGDAVVVGRLGERSLGLSRSRARVRPVAIDAVVNTRPIPLEPPQLRSSKQMRHRRRAVEAEPAVEAERAPLGQLYCSLDCAAWTCAFENRQRSSPSGK